MDNTSSDVQSALGRTSKLLKNYWADECGATGIEYALVAALISMAIISGIISFEESLHDIFHDITVLLAGPGDDPFAGKL